MSKQSAAGHAVFHTKKTFKPKKPRAHFRPPHALWMAALMARYRIRAYVQHVGIG